MKAIVLAGGRGARLMPLTANIPKPMVPLVDKPVLEHVILHLKRYGFTEIGVTLGYLADRVIAYFKNGEDYGVELTYFVEKAPLGTAGSVKSAASFVSEDFLVVSGDGYSETDYARVVAFHKEKHSPFTLVATPCSDPAAFGVVTPDFDGKLADFTEKPGTHSPALVNVGTYVVRRDVLDRIPDGFYDFGKDLIPRLTREAYVYPDYAYWSDVGTLQSYYDTCARLARVSLPVR